MSNLDPTKKGEKDMAIQNRYGDTPKPEQIIAYAGSVVLSVVVMIYIAYALTPLLHANQYLTVVYYMVLALIGMVIIYVATYFALAIKKMIKK